MSERDRLRYAANPERERARVRQYAKSHPDKTRERWQRFYLANREKMIARAQQRYALLSPEERRANEARRAPRPTQNREWDQKNPGRRNYLQRRRRTPEVISADAERRRSFLLRAPGRGITSEQWKEVVSSYCGLCAYCNKTCRASMDHIEPLSRGGAHDIENVAPVCRSCNPSKCNTPLLVWLARRAA